MNARGDACTIEVSVAITMLERECHDLTDTQIATAALQLIVDQQGIFPSEAPKFRFTERRPFADWSFTAELKVLEKPVLRAETLVEELKAALHEEDLESLELVRKRLISLVQSKVQCRFPESYLKSLETPVGALEVWTETIALAALADLIVPGSSRSLDRAERQKRAIDWIVDSAVTADDPNLESVQ